LQRLNARFERDGKSAIAHQLVVLRMIFSENRCTLFRIMR
jgi:hypothetical protein